MELRPYQLEGIRLGTETFRAGVRGAHLLMTAPTGTGKSYIEQEILDACQDVYLITPALEIVRDMLRKRGFDGESYLSDEQAAELGQAHRIWTPIRLRNQLIQGAVPVPKGLLWDECVVGSTRVDGRRIDSLQVGDTVATHGGVRRITAVQCNPVSETLIGLMVGTRVVYCTPNHPIATNAGWLRAGEIADARESLLRAMFIAVRIPEDVQPKVLERNEFAAHVENESMLRLGAYAGAESDATCVRPCQGVGGDARSVPGKTWRQRDRNDCTASSTAPRDARAVDTGMGRTDGSWGPCQRSFDALQDRLSDTENQIGNRDRRSIPRLSAGSRSPEGSILEWARLDCVEVLERGRDAEFDSVCPDGRVYNVTVDEYHTYFAEGVLVHNCHHEQSNSWQEVSALCGDPPAVGLTATGFRGTPKSTSEFLQRWGQPRQLISIREAAHLGFLSVPHCRMVPLLDDDIIEVKDGEFSVRSANKEIASRVDDLCRLVQGYYGEGHFGPHYDKPTMIALPSTETVQWVTTRLRELGLPAVDVTADTSSGERQAAFGSTIARKTVLVQIKVVGEGVDLPLRRLVDLRPTLSPVAFLQLFGRITRPGGESEYVCCCRNLLRHAYLLEGLVPTGVIAEGTDAFMGPGKRDGLRRVGMEGIGRLKPADVRFADGTVGQLFCVSQLHDNRVMQYTVLLHSCLLEPLIAMREYAAGIDPRTRGKWVRVAALPDFEGYSSEKPTEPSPKMLDWWHGRTAGGRGAAHYGLDPDQKVNRKVFQALPVLANTGVRFCNG